MIGNIISLSFSNKEDFAVVANAYNNALENSRHYEKIGFTDCSKLSRKPNRRKRNIIWFNPPFSQNVSTNIGKKFFELIKKHSPPPRDTNFIK